MEDDSEVDGTGAYRPSPQSVRCHGRGLLRQCKGVLSRIVQIPISRSFRVRRGFRDGRVRASVHARLWGSESWNLCVAVGQGVIGGRRAYSVSRGGIWPRRVLCGVRRRYETGGLASIVECVESLRQLLSLLEGGVLRCIEGHIRWQRIMVRSACECMNGFRSVCRWG